MVDENERGKWGKVEKVEKVEFSSVGSSRCFSFRFSRGERVRELKTTVRKEKVRRERDPNWVLISCVSPVFQIINYYYYH